MVARAGEDTWEADGLYGPLREIQDSVQHANLRIFTTPVEQWCRLLCLFAGFDVDTASFICLPRRPSNRVTHTILLKVISTPGILIK